LRLWVENRSTRSVGLRLSGTIRWGEPPWLRQDVIGTLAVERFSVVN